MDNFKITLFLCNWGAYSAFENLLDRKELLPSGVRMIRIPCTGRISKALLFKAFEKGADGVALIGCEPGSCRYGTGTDTARKNCQDTRDILELIGMGKERLRLATFLPDESGPLLKFLETFFNDIKALGNSPIAADNHRESVPANQKEIDRIIASHDAFACQDCGKCTSSCPLALFGMPFSPRALVNSIMAGEINTPLVQKDVWACLTCGICYERCPSSVNFSEFIRDIRNAISTGNSDGHTVHGGFFQSLMRAMTSPDLKPNQWSWLPEGIRTNEESKTLFFGGCSPYLDIFFKKHQRSQTTRILVDSLRLLNFFDIEPALLKEERCCGHDLLWSGDQENFLKLARINVDLLNSTGAEEIVTSCPECYRTLTRDYAEHGMKLNARVTHIYELLEAEIDKGAVGFKKLNKNITFQDSCRLTRFEKKADLPRKLIRRIAPDQFREMQSNGNAALCCGNCAWTGCGASNKAMQKKRLLQARETGSELLVTSCPKCQIHLRCAMQDPFQENEIKMDMIDLTSIVAKTIYWE